MEKERRETKMNSEGTLVKSCARMSQELTHAEKCAFQSGVEAERRLHHCNKSTWFGPLKGPPIEVVAMEVEGRET